MSCVPIFHLYNRVFEFLRGALGLTSSFIKVPIVRADDEDEEEELVDPFQAIRVRIVFKFYT